jgi:hypothetical protein
MRSRIELRVGWRVNKFTETLRDTIREAQIRTVNGFWRQEVPSECNCVSGLPVRQFEQSGYRLLC